MRRAWRFFVDSEGRWQWQMLGPNQTVIAASPSSYEIYEQCIAAATAAGYAFEQAQPPLPRTRTSAGRSASIAAHRDVRQFGGRAMH